MQETGISSHFLCKLEPANFFPSSLFRPFNAVCCRFLGRTKLNPRMSTSEERRREREKKMFPPFRCPPFLIYIYSFISPAPLPLSCVWNQRKRIHFLVSWFLCHTEHATHMDVKKLTPYFLGADLQQFLRIF